MAHLKGGDGIRGSLKGFFYASRNEAILSDMRVTMANTVAMFKVCEVMIIDHSDVAFIHE